MVQILLHILINIEKFSTDSALAIAEELKNSPIAIKNEANNWGFILFFICFFIVVSIISKNNKFLLSMFSRLYRNKGRHSMFYETLTNETLNKLLLSLQTVLLVSIIVYCYATREDFLSITSITQMLLFIGKISLTLIAFLLYKYLTYTIIGAIFFRKETVIQWNDDFFSLLSLDGLILFIPTLILFYVETAYMLCIYLLVFFLITNLVFVFYKLYTLFFHRKEHLVYFILYLCTQEIIPLYLVYRGLVYLITQTNNIWMQV